MPARPDNRIEELERTLSRGEGPAAIAVVGSDGYLVSVAAKRLAGAIAASGLEVRDFQGDPVTLADELRTGALFGSGAVFVVEDPEWMVGAGGDRRKRLLAIAEAAREKKRTAGKRLVEFLVAAGATWEAEKPEHARSILDELLDETGADGTTAAALRDLLLQASGENLEVRKGAEPLDELERAIGASASGNRLLLSLSSRPAKGSRAATILSRIETISLSIPAGKELAGWLSAMANEVARVARVRLDSPALDVLISRTAPPERAGRDRSGEASVRLFRTELDKLLQAAGAGGAVTRDLAESLVADARSATPWEIDGPLVRRDAAAAIQQLRRLLPRRRSKEDEDREAAGRLGYLAGRFRTVVALHSLVGPDTVRQAGRTGYPAWKARWLSSFSPLLESGKSDYPLFVATQLASSFTAAEALDALRRLAAMDERAKSGGPPLRDQLEGFLLTFVPRRREDRYAAP